MSSFFLASLVLFIVWLVVLLFSSPTRKEQLIMSVVGLVLAPGVLSAMIGDYRRLAGTNSGMIGFEDLLFSFSLFGIGAVIYHALIGAHAHKWKGARLVHPHPVVHWLAGLIIVLSLWAFISLLLLSVFDLTSIRALIAGGVMIGIYVIADRHNLLFNALLSSVFTVVLLFLVEQLFFVRLYPEAAALYWNTGNIALLIGGIPLEELMWAAVVGFTIGPLYEWLRR